MVKSRHQRQCTTLSAPIMMMTRHSSRVRSFPAAALCAGGHSWPHVWGSDWARRSSCSANAWAGLSSPSQRQVPRQPGLVRALAAALFCGRRSGFMIGPLPFILTASSSAVGGGYNGPASTTPVLCNSTPLLRPWATPRSGSRILAGDARSSMRPLLPSPTADDTHTAFTSAHASF